MPHVVQFTFISESFNDWGGRGYDDCVPGEITKTDPSGIGLHDPLHGRQACSEFNPFHQGVRNMSPGGANFVQFPPKTETNLRHPRPPNR